MTPVRTKDKLFLAIAAPLAAAAAYFWCYRADAAKKLEAIRGETAALVSQETFDDEMRIARRRLADATEELEAERKVKPSVAKVKGDAAETPAEREREVLRVFRDCGIGVMRTEEAQRGTFAADRGQDGLDARAARALAATGVRAEPVMRRYVLDGAYPAVRNALGVFASREMAVVPVSVEMRENGRGRWTVLLWQ
jgi:hypothetical protein